MIGVAEVATAAIALVAPHLPRLVGLAGSAAEKVAETVAEKSGEVAWEKAKAIWGTITRRLGGDPVVGAASTLVAAAPERDDRRANLAEELAVRLGADPNLLEELKALLGGNRGVQEITAGDRVVLERVAQRMKGAGRQTLRAGNDARLFDIVQDQS